MLGAGFLPGPWSSVSLGPGLRVPLGSMTLSSGLVISLVAKASAQSYSCPKRREPLQEPPLPTQSWMW